jgi:hypothetical protein
MKGRRVEDRWRWKRKELRKEEDNNEEEQKASS